MGFRGGGGAPGVGVEVGTHGGLGRLRGGPPFRSSAACRPWCDVVDVVVRVQSPTRPPSHASPLPSRYDTDHDGRITKAELEQLMQVGGGVGGWGGGGAATCA